jgi:phosphatidate cytidylyltransferase
MSPREALRSPVALFYIALAFGLLLGAGLLLAVLRWGLRRNVDQAWQSYRGWLFIVPLTGAALFLGREAAIVFFTGVALLGFREFARATGLYEDGYLTGGVHLGILAVGVVALVPDPAQRAPGWYGLFMALPVFVVAGLLAIPVLRDRVQGQLHALALAIVGFLLFGWMFGHVAFLANAKPAYAYLLYLLLAVELNDVAAFLAGKFFGRHALRRNISPKKTWEGSLGALAVSLALPWALWFTFPHLRPLDLLAAGLIVGVGGQLGDLAMSVIKRDLGVKDMGATIPGHGGILDRIDSLVYVAPLFFHYIRYRHGLDPPP